jgi:Ca-activated chloride channel family protein
MSDLLERLAGVRFLDPAFLLLALLVPAVLWFRRRRGPSAVLFAPAAFVASGFGERAPRSLRARLAALPVALEIAGLLLVVVALARPVRRDPLPPVAEGIDVIFCLDTSSSMTANDLDPARTRLEVAKGAGARFVAGRKDDRVGLVTFARYPDVRCPPTLDHRALGEILAGVQPVVSDGPEDATGIGTAVARSAQVLRAGTAKSKVVVLLTDGEENVATEETREEIAPLHAGQLGRELGVKVYVIAAGLGTRTRTGEWVELDTAPVRRLAERTGGRFFEARDAGALAAVYGEIDRLERSPVAEPRHRTEERFLPYLAAAAGLLLLGRVLAGTWLTVLP